MRSHPSLPRRSPVVVYVCLPSGQPVLPHDYLSLPAGRQAFDRPELRLRAALHGLWLGRTGGRALRGRLSRHHVPAGGAAGGVSARERVEYSQMKRARVENQYKVRSVASSLNSRLRTGCLPGTARKVSLCWLRNKREMRGQYTEHMKDHRRSLH